MIAGGREQQVVDARRRNVKLDKPGTARVVGSAGYGENTGRVGGSAAPERYARWPGRRERGSIAVKR